ncbi:MAG: hypothetical protein CM15mP120_23050 [Pseudomonadota bacterium]|nr:MAG: hypothetical protein CM15mP120_23050 [Pseudomonadota bacterium]
MERDFAAVTSRLVILKMWLYWGVRKGFQLYLSFPRSVFYECRVLRGPPRPALWERARQSLLILPLPPRKIQRIFAQKMKFPPL